MPLGDSITYGYGDPTFAGYRGPLGSLLAARAATVNFVGSQLAGPGSIEWKTPTGSLSMQQERRHAEIRAAGGEVFICRSVDDYLRAVGLLIGDTL